MFLLAINAADFAGTFAGDQKVSTSGDSNMKIYYSKLFENTNNGGNFILN
ncbi:MAG: hypothetical protein JSS91_05890 [Bacteroidetes bacterium]|nr:hypothetical protein [Bacteroidota bacterium]